MSSTLLTLLSTQQTFKRLRMHNYSIARLLPRPVETELKKKGEEEPISSLSDSRIFKGYFYLLREVESITEQLSPSK